MAAKKSMRSKASKKSNTRSQSSAKKGSKNAPAVGGLNPQVKAIILCAVGALMLALVVIPGGAFWKTMRSFLFGIFGVCSIVVPMVFIYLGIMTAKEKQEFEALSRRVAELEEENRVYHWYSELPDYARPTIERLHRSGVFVGAGPGDMQLSRDMMRILLVLANQQVI